jgi:hypothetical protein
MIINLVISSTILVKHKMVWHSKTIGMTYNLKQME